MKQDEEDRERLARAEARKARIQANIQVEAKDPKFPGAVVEATTADPGSAHGKLSGAPMARIPGGHHNEPRIKAFKNIKNKQKSH